MLGIYEKALPNVTTWKERLLIAKELGFDFIEMSIDETDERLSRLDWTAKDRKSVIDSIFETNIRILSMCLSGHRRYPFGSKDREKREKALEIMSKAVDLATDLGIRTIQLAGYDVYYEEKSVQTRELFIENLKEAVNIASSKGVVLAVEIMDDPFISSITKFLDIKSYISSPYLQVYPDVGNLSAWPENNPGLELEKGRASIAQVHLKDTLKVTDDFPGKFKGVVFGEGCVDFLGCLKTLNRIGYTGSFVIEMWSEQSKQTIEEIKKAQEFLLPILKEAGYGY